MSAHLLPTLLWVWNQQPTRFGLGSQQRSAHLLAALTRFFRVRLVILSELGILEGQADEELLRQCDSCRLLIPDSAPPPPPAQTFHQPSTDPAFFTILKMERAAFERAVVEIFQREKIDAAFLFSFDACVTLREQLPALQPVFLDLDELLSRRQQRFAACPSLAAHEVAPAHKRVLLYQFLERRYLPLFEGVWVCSSIELGHLRGLVASEKAEVIPNATRWTAPLPPPPPGRVRTLFFVGTLNYFPNHDAVVFFLEKIWPLLRAHHGATVRFHLIGARPPASLRPDTVPGVIFERDVEDLAPAYRDADVIVVPLRVGAGTRVKILEAFALGRPVVSTALGAEGLEIEHGRHLLLADEPRAFADACRALLADPALAARLAAEAARWVAAHHSAAAVQAAIARTRLVQHFHPGA